MKKNPISTEMDPYGFAEGKDFWGGSLGCMSEPCCMPQASLSWLGCVFPSPSAVLTTLQDRAHIPAPERVAGH